MGQISKNDHFPDCNVIRGGGGGREFLVSGVRDGRKDVQHVKRRRG